jgi:hypothetical protein
MVITDNESLIDRGATRVLVTGHWHVFRDTTGQGDYDTSRVDVEQMDRAAEGVEDNGDPFLLDVEVFDNDEQALVENMRLALMRWKSAKPTRPIGMYRLLPQRNFWPPVTRYMYQSGETNAQTWLEAERRYDVWKAYNDRVAAELMPLVDFLCPSVYALDSRYMRYWGAYADANIREAARVADGKPVWPIIQPLYRGGGQLEAAQWSKMVELMAEHPQSDASMIYCPESYEPHLHAGWERPVLELIGEQPDTQDALDAEPSAVDE